MTIEVPLTQGQVALIDDCDADLVLCHKWHAQNSKVGFYAETWIYTGAGSRAKPGRRTVAMHRMIMGEPEGLMIDHASLDTLDNRRANLRLATRVQNKANGRLHRNNASGFKGVYKRKGYEMWVAQIKGPDRLISLGYFTSPEEAARVYDAKARELHGEYARCNFPL